MIDTQTLLLILVVTTFGNVCCFILGSRVFQQISKGEKVGVEIPNPVKVVQNTLDSFEEKKEQEKYKVIMDNIDNYNGTSIGQKEIPGS